MRPLTSEKTKSYAEHYKQEKNVVIANAITKNAINDVVLNGEALRRTQHMFSNEITTLKVTNQKSSGRCWIYAGLNVLRESLTKSLNLEEFEFSQNYVAFWDKYEKCNYFLQSIMDTFEEDADSRLVHWIIQTGISDGGQWDMFTSVLEKYGVVPKDAMPETFHSSNTGSLNKLLNTKLRRSASILRELHAKGASEEEILSEVDHMMQDFYTLLSMSFGTPPSEFIWEYRDKDKKFVRTETTTPLEFYSKYVGESLKEYVSIIHAPTTDKPYNKTYTVRYLGNVVGGNDILYINTEMKTLKEITLRQLLNEETVWFGSDVGGGMDRDTGILDSEMYDYNAAFHMSFEMTKEEKLNYRESAMNHAMVITGVNLVDGLPNRWKIQNSWGDEKGLKGYFVMTDPWFDEYVYQVVVHKKYLTESLQSVLNEEPIVLNPWDPMGSLA